MADITKTAGTSLLSLQSIASGSVVKSSAQDVSSKLAATVFISFGRRAATALTVPFRFRIEASSQSSGDEDWVPLALFYSATAAAADEAANGTVSAAQAVYLMASTTGFAVNDLVFCDAASIGDSEWHRIITVTTNTSVTFEQDLANAQTGGTCYGQAELWVAQIDLTAVTRIRVVASNVGTGQAVAIKCDMVTGDAVE